MSMDPFNSITMKFYNELCEEQLTIYDCQNHRKWFLLACDMILKEKNLNCSVYNKTIMELSFIFSDDFSDYEWIFVIDCARKAVKRLKGQFNPDIKKILTFINDNIMAIDCRNHLLKLILTCKDYEINMDWDTEFFKRLYEDDFSYEINPIDFDEFNFINCDKSSLSTKQQTERLLILLDPVRINRSDEYLFNLFSISDSQLIQLMKRLLKANEERFYEFYVFIIYEELLSVDFLIEQLLTDSIDLLELLLAVFGTFPKLKRRKSDFKNFHTLLLLKLESCPEAFPFKCDFLIEKLKYFMNKI